MHMGSASLILHSTSFSSPRHSDSFVLRSIHALEPLLADFDALMPPLDGPVVESSSNALNGHIAARTRENSSELNPVEESMISTLPSRDGHRVRCVSDENDPSIAQTVEIPLFHPQGTDGPAKELVFVRYRALEEVVVRRRQCADCPQLLLDLVVDGRLGTLGGLRFGGLVASA